MTQQSSMSNEFNAKLESLNLDSVAQILVNERGWSSQQTERAIATYAKYLLLCAQNPGRVLVPSAEIDLMLHLHLKTGSKFAEDCRRTLGCIIQHEPVESCNEADRQIWTTAFRHTKALFEKTFGFGTMGTSGGANCFTIATLSA